MENKLNNTAEMLRLVKTKLKAELPQNLYQHTICVVDCAKALAKKYGYRDGGLCELAALLHDCCKHYSYGELRELSNRLGYAPRPWEEMAPQILHAPVGAVRAVFEFGVGDGEVFEAICHHTTGASRMGVLAKIIYCADKISEDRDYPGVEQLRKKVEQGLNSLSLSIAGSTIAYLVQKQRFIAPPTLEFYNELVELNQVGKDF